MSESGFLVTDIGFASLCCFLYTDASVLSIRRIDARKVEFTFDINHDEAADLWQQFNSGELQIQNPKELFRAYSALTFRLKQMQRSEDFEWRRN